MTSVLFERYVKVGVFLTSFVLRRAWVCDGLSVPFNPALCCEGKTRHTIQTQSSSVFKIVVRNNALPIHGL